MTQCEHQPSQKFVNTAFMSGIRPTSPATLQSLPPPKGCTGMTLQQITSKWLELVLAFIGFDGFFEESIVPSRNIDRVHLQKKEEVYLDMSMLQS